MVQVGKGKLYLFGFSLGYSYYIENSNAYLSFMDDVLQDAGAKKYQYANCAEGIYEKRLQQADFRAFVILEKQKRKPRWDFLFLWCGREELKTHVSS